MDTTKIPNRKVRSKKKRNGNRLNGKQNNESSREDTVGSTVEDIIKESLSMKINPDEMGINGLIEVLDDTRTRNSDRGTVPLPLPSPIPPTASARNSALDVHSPYSQRSPQSSIGNGSNAKYYQDSNTMAQAMPLPTISSHGIERQISPASWTDDGKDDEKAVELVNEPNPMMQYGDSASRSRKSYYSDRSRHRKSAPGNATQMQRALAAAYRKHSANNLYQHQHHQHSLKKKRSMNVHENSRNSLQGYGHRHGHGHVAEGSSQFNLNMEFNPEELDEMGFIPPLDVNGVALTPQASPNLKPQLSPQISPLPSMINSGTVNKTFSANTGSTVEIHGRHSSLNIVSQDRGFTFSSPSRAASLVVLDIYGDSAPQASLDADGARVHHESSEDSDGLYDDVSDREEGGQDTTTDLGGYVDRKSSDYVTRRCEVVEEEIE